MSYDKSIRAFADDGLVSSGAVRKQWCLQKRYSWISVPSKNSRACMKIVKNISTLQMTTNKIKMFSRFRHHVIF